MLSLLYVFPPICITPLSPYNDRCYPGLQNMCIGEKRRMFIPSTLAYGKLGDSKNVPPGADLVYDVEVVRKLYFFFLFQALFVKARLDGFK